MNMLYRPRGTLPRPGKNHGEYVTCVEKLAGALFKAGLITGKKRGDMVSAAAKSDCGTKK